MKLVSKLVIATILATGMSFTASAQQTPAPTPTPTPAPQPPLILPNGDRTGSSTDLDLYLNNETNPQLESERYSRLVQFAECAYKRDPSAVTGLLATQAGSAAESRSIRYVMRRYRGCGSTFLALRPVSMRGAAAEAVMGIHTDYVNSPVARTSLTALTPDRIAGPATSDLAQFADCQILLAPRETVAYLQTQVGSPDETAARQRMFDASSRCGSEDTLTAYLNVVHRAYVARAFHARLSQAGVLFGGSA